MQSEVISLHEHATQSSLRPITFVKDPHCCQDVIYEYCTCSCFLSCCTCGLFK